MRRRTPAAVLGLAAAFFGAGVAGAQTFTTYRCADGSEFVAAFYPGDKSAYVQLDGKALTLPKRLSLGGPRYAKGGVTLRMAKSGVTLKRRGLPVTACGAD